MSENKYTPEPWEDPSCIKRFWSKVDVAGKDDCWVWQRGISGFGYGNFHYGNMSIRAHRFSYQLHNGKIRNHDCVCHSCDNPKCVNPAHLWIGTRAENNADKEAKKRGVYPVQSNGEANTNSILTTPEVIAARVMARKGLPQARIAKLLGVSTATVCMIVNGERRSEETEQRVSACVNRLAQFTTEQIEDFGYDLFAEDRPRLVEAQNEIHLLKKQRDELLAALEKLAVAEKQRDELLAAVEYLWNIIDDIDTYGDVAKSNDRLFRKLVERRQSDRWKTGITTDGYTLNYDAITSVKEKSDGH